MENPENPSRNPPRLEDFSNVLRVCTLLENKRNPCKSVRDIAERLQEPVSTLTNQIRRVVNYLVPSAVDRLIPVEDTQNASGLGRESLYRQEPDQTLAISDFGALVRSRILMLNEFLADFQNRAGALTSRNRRHREVRIGGPQTIVYRLLANAFSSPESIHVEMQESEYPKLDLIPGNTYRELIPKLCIGLLDFVVGYGDVEFGSEPKPEYQSLKFDPDILDAIAFSPLGYKAKMAFMCHPRCTLTFKNGKSVVAGDLSGEMKKIHPELIDFRFTPLIAVPSWRQPPMLQFLMEEARRLQRLREVNQFDDALALVRVNAGVAIIGLPFSGRRGVKSFNFADSKSYERPIGIYYRRKDGLSQDACRFAEFLRAYIQTYSTKLDNHTPGLDSKDFNFPTEIVFEKARDWVNVSATQYPIRSPGPGDSAML